MVGCVRRAENMRVDIAIRGEFKGELGLMWEMSRTPGEEAVGPASRFWGEISIWEMDADESKTRLGLFKTRELASQDSSRGRIIGVGGMQGLRALWRTGTAETGAGSSRHPEIPPVPNAKVPAG